MRIGVIGSPSGWYWEDLQRAAATISPGPVELIPVPFRSLSAGLEASESWISSPSVSFRQLDGALVRSMPPGSLEQIIFRMDVLNALAAEGFPVINPPRALEAAIDKYWSLARLQAAGLPVPATIVAQTDEAAWEAFHQLGGDVVVKPIFGSEGRGMIRLTDPEIARRVFGTLTRIQAVLYLQKFIANSGSDVRLLVIGDQVLGMRRVCRQDWRANLAQGGMPEPIHVDSHRIQLAQRAAQAIGAEIAAVDVLPGRDGTDYLLEVNAVPGWRGLAQTLHVDVARLVLLHVQQRIHSGPDRGRPDTGTGRECAAAPVLASSRPR